MKPAMTMNHRAGRRSRRGMLLLLVLSVLTLFLLMGSLALILAMRARESARAFAKVMSGARARPVMVQSRLDEALLVLIRGTQDPVAKQAVTESLLGDMYGTPPKPVPFVEEKPGEAAHDAIESDAFLTGYSQGRPPEVDNDGDGQPDGPWLSGVLPPVSSPDGGQTTFRVSYLVQDLDGRINVNAHGSPFGDEPVGPASVDGSPIFLNATVAIGSGTVSGPVITPAAMVNASTGSNTVWLDLMIPDQLQRTATASTQSQWRPAPLIDAGMTVEGRFGGTPASTYSLRLDREARRPAVLSAAAAGNPFTPGELERVLRPFDADTTTLPPRLAAILDDTAGTVRGFTTTDSWDVTCKTGVAAQGLAARELRFDLNRPVADDAAKQQYAADLLAVVVKAGAPNDDDSKKWTAKVADLRAQKEFTSVGELLTIPISDEKKYSLVAKQNPGEGILQAVMVPSRFAPTIAADPWREPGRVNVNTCNENVWKLVCGNDKLATKRPDRPITSLWKLLTDTAGGKDDVASVDKDLANRLASIATVRSNVFAVWITVEITDASPTAAPPSCHRLFAIVDRSIPVQYAEGQNNDVREMIRLKRFLD